MPGAVHARLRRHGPALSALGVSLLLHVFLLGGTRHAWPPERIAAPAAPVIEARLLAAPPRHDAKPARVPGQETMRRPAPPRPLPAPPATRPDTLPDGHGAMMAADDAPAATPAASEAAPPEPAPPAEPGAPVASPAPSATSETPAPPPLNALPARIALNFELHYGPATGEQTLIWVDEGGRYTASSVAAATGFTGFFVRGRFAQTSRGRIAPHGLEPEEFWDQRGDRRSRARIEAGRIAWTSAAGETRHFDHAPGLQDALSLFFQWALTAPLPQGKSAFAVFNGRKVRNYVFEVRGEEILETALGPLRTQHLVRNGSGDGRFEVWLAIDRHYLPVQVLGGDEAGLAMEMRIRSITPY